MKNFSLICLVHVFLFCAKKSESQVFATPGLSGSVVSPTSYPGSPNAGETDEFQNKANNFTGTKSINLPLFDFESYGFKLPISLSYDASGVRVLDMASWVGLKWSLNCGGIITREVKGIPDEANSSNRTGRLTRYHNNNFDYTTKINNITNVHSAANAANIDEVYNGGNNRFDMEPDIFTYNINGISGKFIVEQNGTVKLIPYRDMEITTDYSLGSFTIIDERGITYVFNTTEQTLIKSYGWAAETRAAQYPNYTQDSLQYISCWRISQIILPIHTGLASKTISFDYADEAYSISDPSSIWARSCVNAGCAGLSLFASGSPNSIVNSYQTIAGKRLISVEDENTILNFDELPDVRQDLYNTHALSSIRVSRKFPALQEIKRYQFIYDYYTGTDPQTFIKYVNESDQNNYTKRLMLTAVSESFLFDQNNNPIEESEPLYSFEYNRTAVMPSRFTYEQDFWGYYNGNAANTIFPKLYIYPSEPGKDRYDIYPRSSYTGSEIILDGANRNPNANTISLGTLTKITFKTGGSTSYEYEPNDFYYNGDNRLGAGIRLKKSVVYDGINHAQDIIKEYAYRKSSNSSQSSGLLIDMPVFAAPENYHPVSTGTVSSIGYTDPLQSWYYEDFLVRNSMPLRSDGISMGYTEVVEKNSDNSKIYFKYSLPGYYKQDKDDQAGVNCFLDKDGYCDGLFTRYFSYYCASYQAFLINAQQGISNPVPDLSGYDFSTNSIIPFGPAVNYEWNRGLLLETKYYDASDFLLKENKYTYKVYYPDDKTTPDYVPGLKMNEVDNWKLDPSNNTVNNTIGFSYSGLYLFTKYDILTGVTKLMDSKTEKSYDKNHPGQYVQTVVTYEYNGINHTNPTKETFTDSRGVQKSVEYLYSFDLLKPTNFNVNSYPGIYPQKAYKALTLTHINTPIRKLETYKDPGNSNEYITSASVNYFDATLLDAPSNLYSPILLKENKLLSLNTPILKSTLTDVINSNGFVIDSRYETENFFSMYDANTNLLEYSNRSEKRASLWGYNNKYAIAVVENAAYADIAYSSFEEADNKGNWNYSSSSEDIGLTGKKSYYLATGNITKNSLDANKTYTVSYWSKGGQYSILGGTSTAKQGITMNGWTYYEHECTGASSIAINAPGGTLNSWIDEVRLYPKNARMTTYIYTPLVGITTQCDINNEITYYEYDSMGRMKLIRDKNNNILKTFEYKFQQPF